MMLVCIRSLDTCLQHIKIIVADSFRFFGKKCFFVPYFCLFSKYYTTTIFIEYFYFSKKYFLILSFSYNL